MKSVFGETVVSLDHEKLLVLAACVSDGYTSNYRIQFVLEKHPSDITQLLKTLCQEGYLISSGIGKGTRYIINDRYLSFEKEASFGYDFSHDYAGSSEFLNVDSSETNVASLDVLTFKCTGHSGINCTPHGGNKCTGCGRIGMILTCRCWMTGCGGWG